MRLKNSIKMIFTTFGLTYKVLLYKLIVFVFFMLIGLFAILPNFNSIIEASNIKNLLYAGFDVIKSIFTTSDVLTPELARAAFTENLTLFNNYINGNLSGMYILLVVLAIFYVFGGFLNNLSDFAAGEVINDHMSSLTNRGFVVSIFKDLKKSSIYALIEIAVSSVFFATELSLAVLIYMIGFDYIGMFSLFISIMLFILLGALKNTFMSSFMPGIITDGKKVGKAFSESVKLTKKQFGKIFSTYVTLNILILFAYVSVAICTFGTGLILIIPLSVIIIICFEFVNFYTLNSKKFYISYDEIITPLGENEGLDMVKNIDE